MQKPDRDTTKIKDIKKWKKEEEPQANILYANRHKK